MSVPPDQATNLQVTSISTSSVVITWNKPTHFGTGGFSAYYVYAISGNNYGSHTVITTNVNNCSLTVPSLVSGGTYTYIIHVLNNGGLESISEYLTEVFINKYPTAPTIKSVTFPVAGSALVTWTAPTNFGDGFAGYTVYAIQPGNIQREILLSTKVTSATITGIVPNVAYTYIVAVKAIDGLLSDSNGYVATNVVTVPPGIPTNISGVYVKSTATLGNVEIKWSAPSNGGSAITGYTIKIYNSNSKVVQTVSVSPSSLRYVFSLQRGVGYTYTVTATNKAGPGKESARTGVVNVPTVRVTTAGLPQNLHDIAPRAVGHRYLMNRIPTVRATKPGLPGIPQNLKVTVSGPTVDNTTYTVSWTAPASIGGSPIKGYIVSGTTAAVGKFTMPQTTGMSLAITDQPGNTDIVFSVVAVNASGSGPAASVVSPKYITGPSRCQNVVASYASGYVTVTWDPPTNNGGAPISMYTVHGTITRNYSTIINGVKNYNRGFAQVNVSPSNSGGVFLKESPSALLKTVSGSINNPDTTVLVTGFTNNSNGQLTYIPFLYTFNVTASNSKGTSPISISNEVTL